MPAATILVVDDSAEVRGFLAETLLRPSGYIALTAEDGAAGLRLARDAKPDVIIADVRMPGLTGLELAQRLRAEPYPIPVILITAEGSEALAQQALRAGVADYLIKPFDPDELLASLSRVLEAERQRREYARAQAELKNVNEQLNRRLREMSALLEVGRNVTAVLELDQVLSKVVEAAVALTETEEGALLLQDERTHELVMRAAKNFDDAFVRTFRLPSEDSLAGNVLRTGEPILLDDKTPKKIVTQYLVHTLAYVPLRGRGRVLGVLGVDNRVAGRRLTEHDLQVLQLLADYAAVAIENARLYANTELERAQLDTILRQTEDGVLVVDGEGRLLLINPPAREAFGVEAGVPVTGYKLERFIGNPQVRELFASQQRGGEIQLEDGRVFNAHVSPIEGVGHALVMQDITHLKKLDRIKSEFVTTVSHDLRSPLTAILGYVELIPRVGPVTDQQAEFVSRVRTGVLTINALITDLLDLGRIETGFDAQKEPTAVQLIARYVVSNVTQHCQAKQQTLAVDLPEELPPVFGSPVRLRQMFSNLLDNASKYTPEGGHITFLARVEGDQIIFTVRDSGIGIAPADQPYIFDKFYRASNARYDFAGTGLGLSIVKSIVEAHGGRIWLESKLNVGTTFTVVLPIHTEKESSSKIQDSN